MCFNNDIDVTHRPIESFEIQFFAFINLKSQQSSDDIAEKKQIFFHIPAIVCMNDRASIKFNDLESHYASSHHAGDIK